MSRKTGFLFVAIPFMLLIIGCVKSINSSLWDIAERNGQDQVFAAKVNGRVGMYVWISEKVNPMGRINPSEKSVAYAHQRALKRGMRLLGKHAYIVDVRNTYNDSFSALGGSVKIPTGDRINILMSTP